MNQGSLLHRERVGTGGLQRPDDLMIRNSGEGSLGREGKSAQSGAKYIVIGTQSCAIHLPR